MNFSDLGLSPEVLRAVEDAGYKQPTPIQEQAIPYVLMGRDVLGCAQTGTGKTASFTLPMIDILASGRARARMPRTLVIEPTRELAAQVSEAFDVYGKHHKLNQALLIGGESFTDQERKLDRGVDVLIATPGRLIDLFERGKILLSDVKILVIDEADRMLDMGFIPDVERIVGLLPKIRQTLFFSATMPPEIRRLADAFLMNPKEISVAPPASPAATVTQGLVVVQPDQKRDVLRRLIASENVKNALIFCNRKRDVDILYRSLKRHGLDVAALHGDMPQSKRTETLERFRNDEIRLLVASDVAARGLDIQGMSHVFNFDVPIHAEDYVHRIGRTGRAGREGRAFTLAAPEDGRFVQTIEQLIGKPIPPVSVDGIAAATLSFEDGDGRSRGRSRRGHGKSHGAAPQHGKPRQSAPRHEPPRAAKPHEPAHKPETARQPAPARFAPITMGATPPAEPPRATAASADKPDRHNSDDGPRVVGFGDHMPAFLARRAARG
ncbi:MAG: DEAD/DEAH box helicase [Alphaproteobacteria bacterium]|nr:DEAD/DEAH box helicase [Alphaproteobacteria bacterium]